jgi:hypothetical protein
LAYGEYWILHRDHILSAQREEDSVWHEYSGLMQRLFAEEKEPSLAKARTFIDDELFRCRGWEK